MNANELKPYEKLYQLRHAHASGAAKLLKDFLNLEPNQAVPLTLSHGVDFDQFWQPMDITSLEPAYWAYNEKLYQRAKTVKPSVLMPHPVSIVARTVDIPTGDGTLIVGPPAGPENDERLYQLIRSRLDSTCSMLVKWRGPYHGSIRYWQSLGVKTASITAGQSTFYEAVVALLSKYRRVVACTFSSALIFAAALGKEVELISGYRYRA